jgi:uncharacterized protein YhbP (UPF0306 family)
MDNFDEPVMTGPPNGTGPNPLTTDQLKEKIHELVSSQPFAVLCTQGEGQPYGSLVAFAFYDNLKKMMFATPMATRKYRLLRDCPQVAMLVDNRPEHTDDMMQVEALTITGWARQVETGPDFDRCFDLLTGRHPYLKSFVASDSSALFEITVNRMLHVTRFKEVNQWVPETP